jgi:hypothetical protein
MTPRRVDLKVLIGVIGITTAALAARLATLPRAPDVEDSVVFVRGVVRFSLTEMRPHWPGYPVYIWAGKLVNAVVGDPVLALHLVSALASVLVAWPLAWIARAWAACPSTSSVRPAWAGWAAATLWLVTPAAWVTGAQIISDPLGLLVGVCVLALCIVGERGRAAPWIAAAVLGGLMVGVRMVNVTMLGPLLWKAWDARRERWWGWPAPLVLLGGMALGAMPWLAWLLADAPLEALISGGRYHVGGHFGFWGGSVITDRHLALRPLIAARNLAVYGLGAGWHGESSRLVASAAWLAAVGLATAQRPWRGPVARLVGLWAVPHLAYVFLGHDVAYPRYMLTAVALACVIGGLAASGPHRTGVAAVAVAVAATAASSAPIAVAQERQPPVDYRMARFLSRQPRAAVLVTDAHRLPLYLPVEAPEVTYELAPAREAERWRLVWEAQGRRVFSTAPPEDDPAGWRPVAHFCRDPLIDPRFGYDAWLFAPVSAPAPYPAPDCYTAE